MGSDDIITGDIVKGIIDLKEPANDVLLAIAKMLIESRSAPEDAVELHIKDELGLVYKIILSVEEYPQLQVINNEGKTTTH